LYDEDGTLLVRHEEVVPPMSLHQIDKVYETLAGLTDARGYAVILSTREGSVYCSLVDQSTGDSSTITPFYIDRTGNHAPVFEGMDYHADGTIDWGDADGDGYADVSISMYPDAPSIDGRMVFSDPDGDAVTCTWSPGVGYDAMPAGFVTNGCNWTFSPPRVPGQYWVAVTASDGRDSTTVEQLYNVRNPPQ